MLNYVPGQDWLQCEILTLHAGKQWHGAGTALMEAAGQLARRKGCTRLWLITTNDNVDALRFYQRRGFCLAGSAGGRTSAWPAASWTQAAVGAPIAQFCCLGSAGSGSVRSGMAAVLYDGHAIPTADPF
jgi:N-acetylglutamate synthase-like GNAT family acetyltransferase